MDCTATDDTFLPQGSGEDSNYRGKNNELLNIIEMGPSDGVASYCCLCYVLQMLILFLLLNYDLDIINQFFTHLQLIGQAPSNSHIMLILLSI